MSGTTSDDTPSKEDNEGGVDGGAGGAFNGVDGCAVPKAAVKESKESLHGDCSPTTFPGADGSDSTCPVVAWILLQCKSLPTLLSSQRV